MNMNYLETIFSKLFADTGLSEGNVQTTIFDHFLYVIKLTDKDGKVSYKVGETATDSNEPGNTTRPETLIKNYNNLGDNCKAEILNKYSLPTAKDKRVNDSMVHKKLVNAPYDYIHCNPMEIHAITRHRDGWDEFFRTLNWEAVDDKILKDVETILKSFNPSQYTAKVKTKVERTSSSKHVVEVDLLRMCNSFFIQELGVPLSRVQNNTILLIGQFNPIVCNKLINNNKKVYIVPDAGDSLTDLEKYVHDNDDYGDIDNYFEIVRDSDDADTVNDSVITRLAKVSNVNFDLIVSNAPYEDGNIVTSYIIENIKYKNFINILPISNYRKNNLFKHIKSVQPVVPGLTQGRQFKDSIVNVTVASISEDENNYTNSIDLLLANNYFGVFTKYVRWVKSQVPFNVITGNKGPKIEALVKDYTHNFFIPTFNFKIYREGNTYEANVKNNITPLLAFLKKNEDVKSGAGSAMYTITNLTETERNNLSKTYYASKVIDTVLSFILRSSLQPYDLIPRLDYKNKSYTDAEILNEAGYDQSEIQDILSRI